MFDTCKYSQVHKLQFLRSSRKRVVYGFAICFKIYFRVCHLLQNIYQNAPPQFISVLETTFLTMELLLVDPTHMKWWTIIFSLSNNNIEAGIEAIEYCCCKTETHAMCNQRIPESEFSRNNHSFRFCSTCMHLSKYTEQAASFLKYNTMYNFIISFCLYGFSKLIYRDS